MKGVSLAASPSPPLLLTAGDGPWAWVRTKFGLLDGPLDTKTTMHSWDAISKLRELGSTIRTQHNETCHTFNMDDDAAMELRLPSNYDDGVGSRVWEASIALALFQRSSASPPIAAGARVLELGAGIGLPGLDLARRPAVTSVMLTDSRARLLELGRSNAAAISKLQASHKRPWAHVQFERLAWGGETRDRGDLEGWRGTNYDLVLGSDICYEPDAVPPLVDFLVELAAPLTMLIAPASRPSWRLLRDELVASARFDVEERLLSLVCTNVDDAQAAEPQASVHSGGVHSLLIVRPLGV